MLNILKVRANAHTTYTYTVIIKKNSSVCRHRLRQAGEHTPLVLFAIPPVARTYCLALQLGPFLLGSTNEMLLREMVYTCCMPSYFNLISIVMVPRNTVVVITFERGCNAKVGGCEENDHYYTLHELCVSE